MADVQAGQGAGAPDDIESSPQARLVAKALNLTGAAVSLALIAGIGIWGYKLIVRDVSGVPVVRSVEGPMRVQPESPGGRPAAHQGLAVNEVAGLGTATPPPDRLTLAPRPVSLRDEDAPLGQLTLASARASDAARSGASYGLEPTEDSPSREAALVALADQIARDASPLGPLRETTQTPLLEELASDAPEAMPDAPDPRTEATAPADEAETAPPDAEEVAQALAEATGEPVSLRPRMRPAGLRTVSLPVASDAAPSPEAAAMDDVPEVDPDSLAAGTRLVQLGAYESAEVARSEWERLSRRFDAYMDGKSRVVQRATSGGRVFYRLRAMGFEDISDARRFCAALMADNAECIPVVVK